MAGTGGVTEQRAVDGGRRAAAILALVAGALSLLAVLAFTLNSFAHLVVALIGAGVAVTGGWYVVANRGTARIVGAVVAALGLVVLVGAFVSAGRSLWALLLAVALGAASVVFARRATHRHVAAVVAADLATAPAAGPAPGPDHEPEVRRREGGEVRPRRRVPGARHRAGGPVDR